MSSHLCVDGIPSDEVSWWEHDAQGIPLCRVCERCRKEKLSKFRPEILAGYDQSDVDEPIDSEDGERFDGDLLDYYDQDD